MMTRFTTLSWRLVLCALGAASAIAAGAAESKQFCPDGAWCWFSDPRALVVDGKVVAAWVTSDGSVQTGRRSLDGGETEITTLAAKFERDDHNNPGLVSLGGGKIAAFYSAHALGDMHLHFGNVSAKAFDWSADRLLGVLDQPPGPRGVTYANPFRLSDEADALWLFWRGANFKPTFSISRDHGATWSAPRNLIKEPKSDADNRPYVKYWSDGRGRIDIVFTDGHPRNEPTNSVYFVRYEHGAFWHADGRRIGGMEALPLAPAQCDRVYDGSTAGRAWLWSVVNDAKGNPVIAYTRLPKEDDHRYHYVSWDGAKWADHEVVSGGKWFPRAVDARKEPEPHYSGGIALDPADPATAILSRPVNGVFEIERWHTPDGGATWTHEAITRGSKTDNVRPYVVSGAPSGKRVVLWMNNVGQYVHYTNFRSELRCLVE